MPVSYRSDDHHLVETIAWRPERPAERVTDRILLSRSTSSSFVVTTKAGDVVINTGTTFQGARHRERFEELLGRPLDVKAIVLTQSHNEDMLCLL
jgi:glyoxylase-like metal-dependent hydrolase (beta-lactamase superfamily II)